MEDIDPPREQRGARKAIYHALDRHGLCSDGTILEQSQQLKDYDNAITRLATAVYPCSCSRRAGRRHRRRGEIPVLPLDYRLGPRQTAG